MSKYVPDISSKRWVIVSTGRTERPGEKSKSMPKAHHACPFCEGHEKESPEETYRVGKGEKNTPGWDVRVVANKFPISDLHEVIIHSTDHKKDMEELSVTQIEKILRTYKNRYNEYKKKGQVLIFCNHGEHAGASLVHPHSQLVVTPFQINLDILSREPISNIVDENKNFIVYCPDFSQWPYEVWITPKNEGTLFGDVTDEEVSSLAPLIKKTLHQILKIFEHGKFDHLPFGYNFYIYPKENWYFRIIPRFVHRAGFELGTGLSVNIVDPIEAALEMRGMDQKMADVLKKLKVRAS